MSLALMIKEELDKAYAWCYSELAPMNRAEVAGAMEVVRGNILEVIGKAKEEFPSSMEPEDYWGWFRKWFGTRT